MKRGALDKAQCLCLSVCSIVSCLGLHSATLTELESSEQAGQEQQSSEPILSARVMDLNGFKKLMAVCDCDTLWLSV